MLVKYEHEVSVSCKLSNRAQRRLEVIADMTANAVHILIITSLQHKHVLTIGLLGWERSEIKPLPAHLHWNFKMDV